MNEPRTSYIAPDGDDVYGDGSEANPWRTLGRARLEMGDRVVVRAGVYMSKEPSCKRQPKKKR